MKKVIAILLVMVCLVGVATGCSAASDVNHNLSQAADNFEVFRKITVYNARTDLIILEMEGLMSLSNNATNELVVTCKVGENEYKKNYVYLPYNNRRWRGAFPRYIQVCLELNYRGCHIAGWWSHSCSICNQG